MEYEVGFTKESRNEVNRAVEYYEGIQPKLSLKLIEEIELATILLSHSPHFQYKKNNLRAYRLKVFPYTMYYYIDELEKRVVIIHFRHSSSGRN